MISTSRKTSSAVARVLFCSFVLAAFSAASAQRSVAALFTLTDDNTSASFQTATADNDFNWTVDGVNQLSQQAFWYRVGNVAEQSLHVLPIAVQGTSDSNFDGNPDTLFVRYNGAGFRTDVRYVLDGGAPGSGTSDMGEQISITNVSDGPMDFHFFQYTDFDVRGTAGDDSAVFTNLNAVDQYEGVARLTETVVTPVPSHREIALFPVTRNKLSDGVATTLSDTPIGTVVGPGDLTWAYQWDVVIQPGSTFQISKDKAIRAVPEPATASLLGLAVGLLLAAQRKRNRRS
jgi:hypothetical protein